MPFDTKRVNGPEVSYDYKKFIKNPKSINVEKYQREKDRKNDDEHRKICKIINISKISFVTFFIFSFENWDYYKGQRLSVH